MLTANEITVILEDQDVLEAVQKLKNDFRKKEVHYLDISDHDFLSLIMMVPSILISLSTGEISFMEEILLNKKARIMSTGDYYLEKDPVVHAMEFLIKGANEWENRFIEVIKLAMKKSFDRSLLLDANIDTSKISDKEFKKKLMNAPYIFIRFLHTFFWYDSNEDLSDIKRISKVEFEKVKEIGEKLELSKTVIFRKFLEYFDVK